MRRLLVAVVAATALLWPHPAGARYAERATQRQTGDGWLGRPSVIAAGYQLGAVSVRQADHRDLFWSLTGSQYHVAHCVQGTVPGWNSNYVLCRVVWADGRSEFVAGLWFDAWCELTAEAGDMAGTPLRVRFRSVEPAGSCAPGAGVYPWTDGNWATATEGYVFPRDAQQPWSRGTVVEVR